MWNILEMFGNNPTKELLEKGAKIIDVRSPGEFNGGHCDGAINVPLDRIRDKVDKIKKMNQPIVLCCASGMRSGQATSILKQAGIECCNGGSWTSVAGKQMDLKHQ